MKNSNLNGVLKWLKNRECDTSEAFIIIKKYAQAKKFKYNKTHEIADFIQIDFTSFVEFYKTYEKPISL